MANQYLYIYAHDSPTVQRMAISTLNYSRLMHCIGWGHLIVQGRLDDAMRVKGTATVYEIELFGTL